MLKDLYDLELNLNNSYKRLQLAHKIVRNIIANEDLINEYNVKYKQRKLEDRISRDFIFSDYNDRIHLIIDVDVSEKELVHLYVRHNGIEFVGKLFKQLGVAPNEDTYFDFSYQKNIYFNYLLNKNVKN